MRTYIISFTTTNVKALNIQTMVVYSSSVEKALDKVFKEVGTKQLFVVNIYMESYK